jgi:hypothetical protein
MGLACPVDADSGIRNDPDPTLSRPSRFDAAEESVEVAHVIVAQRRVALIGGLGLSWIPYRHSLLYRGESGAARDPNP